MSKARQLADLGNVYDDGALSNRNRITNGNFDIWQRGTSGTSGYVADRWTTFLTGSTAVISRQSFTLGQTDVPNEPEYFCRNAVTSSAGAGNFSVLVQRIEDVRTFAGQTVTLSFWAKADASKNIAVEFTQYFGTGGSPSAEVTGLSVTTCALTTSWQKFTVTASISSISGKTLGTDGNDFLGVSFWFDAGSNFNSRTNSLGQQSGTFDIAQVQLEAGDTATPFEHRSYGDELARCQRYFQRYEPLQLKGTMATGSNFGRNGAILPVEMRSTPTITLTSIGTSGHNQLYDGIATYTFTGTIGGNYSNSKIVELDGTVTTSTTGGRPAIWYNDSAYKTRFDLSAEL